MSLKQNTLGSGEWACGGGGVCSRVVLGRGENTCTDVSHAGVSLAAAEILWLGRVKQRESETAVPPLPACHRDRIIEIWSFYWSSGDFAMAIGPRALVANPCFSQ